MKSFILEEKETENNDLFVILTARYFMYLVMPILFIFSIETAGSINSLFIPFISQLWLQAIMFIFIIFFIIKRSRYYYVSAIIAEIVNLIPLIIFWECLFNFEVTSFNIACVINVCISIVSIIFIIKSKSIKKVFIK